MRSRFQHLVTAVRVKWQVAGVRNLVTGGLAGIAVTTANRLIALASAVVLARALGPDGYGVYAFAIALLAILSLGSEQGMYTLLVREVSVAHSNFDAATIIGIRDSAFRIALISSAVIGLVGGVIIWATPIVYNIEERIAITIALAILPINSMIRLGAAILIGLRHLAWAQLVEYFILPVMVLSGILILISVYPFDINPQISMLAYLFSAIIALILVLIVLRNAFVKIAAPQVKSIRIAGLQKRARPFLLIGAAGIITGQLDTVLVGVFLDNSETALYRVAAQGGTLIWFGLQILQSISAPYFSRLHNAGDQKSIQRLFRLTTVFAILSVLPVLFLFVVFGKQLISLTFGIEYLDSYSLLVIISVGYAINASCGPVGTALAMLGEERFVSRTMIVTSIINVVLALVLVQLLGVTGIALSTAFSIALYHVVLRIYAWRRCQI